MDRTVKIAFGRAVPVMIDGHWVQVEEVTVPQSQPWLAQVVGMKGCYHKTVPVKELGVEVLAALALDVFS